MQAITADAENNSVNTPLIVETTVCGAMLAEEAGGVTLPAHSPLERVHLRVRNISESIAPSATGRLRLVPRFRRRSPPADSLGRFRVGGGGHLAAVADA